MGQGVTAGECGRMKTRSRRKGAGQDSKETRAGASSEIGRIGIRWSGIEPLENLASKMTKVSEV